MQCKEITVHAASTVPHPEMSYANFRIGVTLTATLDEHEDMHSSVVALGRMAREKCGILEREHREKLIAEAEAERARYQAEYEEREAQRRATNDDDGIPL